MTIRREEVTAQQCIIAAYHFVFKSREGMDICDYLDIQPSKLYNLTLSAKWKEHLRFWGYEGSIIPEGTEYYQKLSESGMKASFRDAWKQWKRLFDVGGDA